MSIQDDESTGKGEGDVKSTPSINQEVAPPLVSNEAPPPPILFARCILILTTSKTHTKISVNENVL
jgi:hypothetical protein